MRIRPLNAAWLAAWAAAGLPGAGAPALADAVEDAGNILKYAMPIGAAGIAISKEDEDGLLEMGVSYIGAMGTAYGLSSVIRERRPDRSDRRSFPSDSATSAFAAAAFLDKRYGWRYGLPAYALASFVAYSRVEADKHHWQDVAAGAAIGWTFNQLVTTHRTGVSVEPLISLDAISLGLHLRW